MHWPSSDPEHRLAAVRQVIEELTGVPVAASAPDTRLADLGIGSLLLFRFVTRLEEVCEVAVPDEDFDVRNFVTVADVCSVLDRAAA